MHLEREVHSRVMRVSPLYRRGEAQMPLEWKKLGQEGEMFQIQQHNNYYPAHHRRN